MIFFIFIALLWLFAVFPGKKRKPFSKYAHRGLHGQGVLENTTEAFSLAREQGFGAELDVRLTADGVPVVFHDKDLRRIFQMSERVDALSLKELKALTDDLVPTLEDRDAQMAQYSTQMLVPVMMDDADVKDNRARFF